MRKKVSEKKNIWFNGEGVDDTDLSLEQAYNDAIQSGIINNHFGTGVLPENLVQNVIFDSMLASGLLDGKAIEPQKQPQDSNYGNQLEVELSNSQVAGKRTIKVLIIGLDFQNNLQYDRLIFSKNEKQLCSKHYIRVLKVLFNDFIGDPIQSLNLGGRITIKEAKAFALSRECIMVAQDVQPNIFFRDIFVSGTGTIGSVLTTALPSYNIDSLNLTSDYLQLRGLSENDVSSQLGQKFQATTNNIQKITLLLSVKNSVNPTDLEWTGDLIVSLYQLQSALDCPSDIAPGTAIDFDPSNIPLAQLSVNYTSLLNKGIILGETPQPVDFIFSNTPVGAGNIIKSGSYYVLTIKRAGSADKCTVQTATGTDRLSNSKFTIFNGTIWVDVSDEDMWFQVWTDAAQVADGQAYDAGHGIAVPKTIINSQTGLTEDFHLHDIPFIRNDIYYGVVEAITEQSVLVQDQRTGEQVVSQQQFVPNISLITAGDLVERERAADPLIIGNIADKNAKSINSSTVSAAFHHFSMIGNQCILKVIDDPTDGYRYDLNILNLITELTGSGGISNINGLLNGKLIPNISNSDIYYRIADTEILSMIYGDLNGDGIVDEADLLEMQYLIGSDLNVIPTYNEYITLTTLFQTDSGLTWQLLDNDLITVLQSGTDGYIVANPQDGSRAVFGSVSGSFNALTSLSSKRIKILNNIGNPGNNGVFKITGLLNNFALDIQKSYFTSDTILKILRADINGDMIVDSTDLNLLINYVEKVNPFPATSLPALKIGTSFTAIRFNLEKYIDRADDYTASSNRASDIHVLPDILIDGYTDGVPLFGMNLKTSPLSFSINKQLGWYDYLVNSSSNPKLVPAAFNYQSGFVENACTIDGIESNHYPITQNFDPGHNDFFVPNNLIINNNGQILLPDGYFYPVDFEIGTIILEMPAVNFEEEKVINLFTDFVADVSGTGRTRLGYQACRFADCSFVDTHALSNNQVRFGIALRSFSPQLNGIDDDGYSGIIIDGRIGVSLDSESGLLTLKFTNLYEDPILQTMKTRLQITVFLKKAGFKNNPLTIGSTQIQNLFQLV